MNRSIKYLSCFTCGAGFGVLFSWLYLKKKYEKKADEEIDEMKKYFKKKENEINSCHSATTIIHDSLSVDLKPETSYISENNKNRNSEDLPEYGKMFHNKELFRAPYVISPEEFYDEESYEKITLSYFANDRILADDENCMVEDVESAVGSEWEDRFDEFVKGAVYVRNDSRQCDYEILYVDGYYVE